MGIARERLQKYLRDLENQREAVHGGIQVVQGLLADLDAQEAQQASLTMEAGQMRQEQEKRLEARRGRFVQRTLHMPTPDFSGLPVTGGHPGPSEEDDYSNGGAD